jgi:hypothetical protein
MSIAVNRCVLMIEQRFQEKLHAVRLRISRAIVFAVAMAIVLPRLAMAQSDTEPANSIISGANVLTLPAGSALANTAFLGGSGNDVDFFSTPLLTGEVLIGMTTSLGDLPSSFDVPDTIVGVYADSGLQTFNDDDGADELVPAGLNRGSMFRYLSPATGIYQIGVSGFGDQEFDGSATGAEHVEVGPYQLTVGRVNPAILGGGFADTEPLNSGIFPGPGRPGPYQPDLIPLAQNSALVSVAELGDLDIDYFQLNLNAGDILSAMTAPLAGLPGSFDVPDTVLALFDSTGDLLLSNDDAGNEQESTLDPSLASDNPYVPGEIRGSGLRALIPATGTYYLAVTGFSDVDFVGSHLESGRYALLVGRVPEPSTMALALLSMMGIFLSRGRALSTSRRNSSHVLCS